MILVSALAAHASCVSSVPLVRTASAVPALTQGPVAWNGTFLLSASHEEGSDAIWVTLYGEDGFEIAPPRKVANETVNGPAALTWNGSDFGLFYRFNGELYLQRLGVDGTPTSGPILVPTARTVYPGDEIEVVWSTAFQAYVVGRRVGAGTSDVYGMFVTREGLVTREELLDIARNNSEVRVAVTEEGTAGIAFYSGDDTVHMSWLFATGPAVLRGLGLQGGAFVLAADRTELVLLEERVLGDSSSSIYYSSYSADGRVARGEIELVNSPGGLRPIAAVVRESELVLAYRDAPDGFLAEPGDYRLLRFTRDGVLVADTLFAAANAARARSVSEWPFAWTGSAYVNIVPRMLTSGEAAYLVRLCPLSVSIVSSTTVRVGSPVTFSALIDGGVPGYALSWSFGDRNFSNDLQPVHEYDSTGQYTVVLAVTDSTGTETLHAILINVVDGKRRAVGHR